MPSDRGREPIFIHIDEFLAQHTLHVLDAKVYIRPVVDVKSIRASKEIDRRDLVRFKCVRRGRLSEHKLVQAVIKRYQTALHHFPR